MNTKSRPAKNYYVPGASRGTRSVATLRAQMEDLARGERIKTLRTDRHLSQPAVVDLLEKKAGARVVTLRGYQAWEAGGGIRWENAKVLADVFGVEPEYVMAGDGERGPVPDLSLIHGDGDDSQLAEIDRKLDLIIAFLGIEEAASQPETIQDRLVQLVKDAAAASGPPSAPSKRS